MIPGLMENICFIIPLIPEYLFLRRISETTLLFLFVSKIFHATSKELSISSHFLLIISESIFGIKEYLCWRISWMNDRFFDISDESLGLTTRAGISGIAERHLSSFVLDRWFLLIRKLTIERFSACQIFGETWGTKERRSYWFLGLAFSWSMEISLFLSLTLYKVSGEINGLIGCPLYFSFLELSNGSICLEGLDRALPPTFVLFKNCMIFFIRDLAFSIHGTLPLKLTAVSSPSTISFWTFTSQWVCSQIALILNPPPPIMAPRHLEGTNNNNALLRISGAYWIAPACALFWDVVSLWDTVDRWCGTGTDWIVLLLGCCWLFDDSKVLEVGWRFFEGPLLKAL